MSDLTSAIDAVLDSVVSGSPRVPGVAAVATDRDGNIYEGARGERVLGGGTEFTTDTVCAIYSTTKAIGGTEGVLEGNVGQLWIQFEGILATIIYCAVASAIILKVIDLIIGLRVSEEDERQGLDQSLHGESVQ